MKQTMVSIHHSDLLDFSEHSMRVLKSRLGVFFEIPKRKALKGGAIKLNSNYEWKIEKDEFDVLCLVPYENGKHLNLKHLAGIFYIATDRKLKLRNTGRFEKAGFEIIEKEDSNFIEFELGSENYIAFVNKTIDLNMGVKVSDYTLVDWFGE